MKGKKKPEAKPPPTLAEGAEAFQRFERLAKKVINAPKPAPEGEPKAVKEFMPPGSS